MFRPNPGVLPMKYLVATPVLLCLLALSVALPIAAQGEAPRVAEGDWPWWRGPQRNGIADQTPGAPTTWSAASNVVWKVPVPGRGHASPIVVGERVLLATADEAQQIQSVVAFARATGKPLWKTDVSRGGFPARNHPKNTEASSTLASDGERVFATFFHHKNVEAIALDLNGKELWRATVGPFDPQRYEYGYGPSPLVFEGLVIVATEFDGESFLTALDRSTGQRKWRTPRPRNVSFSSPVVGRVAGRDQLLISGANEVSSYDPRTGKALWSVPGTTDATCGTLVWEGDIVFASGGYPKAETLAVRADGSGEVLWRNRQKCYEQSLLVYEGYVYALTDGGILYCWRARDGREMWSQRLRGPVSASPVLAGGNIYWANELGTMYVFRPNPERFELVAENQLDAESFASPAVAGNQIFLRTAATTGGKRQEFLYCIGQ
jgi:outer membrane protein assembly factor BamB